MDFNHILPPFETFHVAFSSTAFNWAKTWSFCDTVFSNPPYCLCMSSIISIHLKDGPSMCPFGTLNQNMFVYIHHKPLSTQGLVSIR
jgi:hypothetical protein